MPASVNGIGTHYYGRRNVYLTKGTCEFCGNYSNLSSYDTNLFFVVFFIPLIPLKKLRILNDCSSCRKHRLLNLDEWLKKKREDIAAATKALTNNPDNPDSAIKAIQVLIGYQDESAFLMAAPGIHQRGAKSQEVLLGLAQGYEYFSRFSEAEPYYREALTLNDDPSIKHSLAINLIRQFKPQEAALFLSNSIKSNDDAGISLTLFLAEGYQATGMHQEALALFDSCQTRRQELAKDKDFLKKKKFSEKNAASKKPLKVSWQTNPAPKSPSKGDGSFNIARLISYAVLSLILVSSLGAYLYSAYSQGKSRNLYIVNGLDTPYDVTVQGKVIKLDARATRNMSVEEGFVDFTVKTPGVNIPPFKIEFTSPFWLRPFSLFQRIDVVNPDKTALIFKEETVYSSTPNPDYVTPYDIFTGKQHYIFKGIDYPFQEFPQSISLSSKSSQATKNRLCTYPRMTDRDEIQLLTEEKNKKYLKDFLLYRFEAQPSKKGYLNLYSEVAGWKEALDVITPLLSVRPVDIEAHRLYQTIVEARSPEHDLEKEYRSLLEKDPSNTALLYLLGRITPDRLESTKLFIESASASTPCPYAYFALSYDASMNADFQKALDFSRKALEADPQNPSFKGQMINMLLANQQHDQFLQEILAAEKKDPASLSLMAEELQPRLLLGQTNIVDTVADGYCARNKITDKQSKDYFHNYAQAIMFYYTGEIPQYLEAMKKLPRYQPGFVDCLLSGDLVNAQTSLSQYSNPSIADYFIFFLVAGEQGDSKLADEFWSKAVNALPTKCREGRLLAAQINEGKIPDFELLKYFPVDTEEKRTILTAMGEKYPTIRKSCWELATKLNYNRVFPYTILKTVIEQKRNTAAIP